MATSLSGTVTGKVVFASVNRARPTMESKKTPGRENETEFNITIELDENEAKRLNAIRKELSVKALLKVEDKNGDLEHPQFTFRRAHVTRTGMVLTPPPVVNRQLEPITEIIGSGSEVTIQYKARAYTEPNSTRIRHTLGLEAVKVLKLIPYESKVELLFTAEAEDDAVDAALKEHSPKEVF